MSVDDWAREQAEECIPAGKAFGSRPPSVPHVERIRFADGIVHAFSALLSDEAVEAVQKELAQHSNIANAANFRVVECACGATFEATVDGWHEFYRHGLPAALQAAVDAVTREARND